MSVPALIGASAGFSFLSNVSQTNAQKQQLELQARASEQKAAASTYMAGQEATQVRRQAEGLEGATVASAAGSGVEVSGSVTDLIKENAFNVEMDAQRAMQNRLLEASAYETEAAGYRSAKPRGVDTLLSGIGTGLSAYGQYKMFQG